MWWMCAWECVTVLAVPVFIQHACASMCLHATAPATLHVSITCMPTHRAHVHNPSCCALHQGCTSSAPCTSVGDSTCVYRVYKLFTREGGAFDSLCVRPCLHAPSTCAVRDRACCTLRVRMHCTCMCSAGSSSHCNPCSFFWLSGPVLPPHPE